MFERHGLTEHLVSSYMSYRGWLQHANAYNLFMKYGNILEEKYRYLKKK